MASHAESISIRTPMPNVFVKVVGRDGCEVDAMFTRLTGAFAEADLEAFVSCIIQEEKSYLESSHAMFGCTTATGSCLLRRWTSSVV